MGVRTPEAEKGMIMDPMTQNIDIDTTHDAFDPISDALSMKRDSAQWSALQELVFAAKPSTSTLPNLFNTTGFGNGNGSIAGHTYGKQAQAHGTRVNPT